MKYGSTFYSRHTGTKTFMYILSQAKYYALYKELETMLYRIYEFAPPIVVSMYTLPTGQTICVSHNVLVIVWYFKYDAFISLSFVKVE